jgi:xanthine dehydrogenase accessory factor
MDLRTTCEFLRDRSSEGKSVVLVTVAAVEGSSMRNPGTIMGVAKDGTYAGSLSGGCIENAVVAEALDVIATGSPRLVRFGAGSPYLDIKLPCGGGLDLLFHPVADPSIPQACLASIKTREPFTLRTDARAITHVPGWSSARVDRDKLSSTFGHWPGPRLQIIGHGAGVEALAVLGRTFGCETRILTPDARVIDQLAARDISAQMIARTDQIELLCSDPWAATIFLFHDHDWEIELIEAAIAQPHFYIGAMGGRRAHAFRTEALLARGVGQAAIDTIRGPIGLFHSSRDPQTLALSTLSEVIRAYHDTDFAGASA